MKKKLVNWILLIIINFIFNLTNLAFALEVSKKSQINTNSSEETDNSQSPWNQISTTHFWFRLSSSNLNSNFLVGDKSIFASPKESKSFLIRESFKIQKDNSQFVFRPSLEIKKEYFIKYPNQELLNREKIETRLNELYLQQEFNNEWQGAIGLQNYQWGPGELMSPSNPLFHFMIDSQDPTFQAHGHNLLRLNYSPKPNLSFITLIEFMRNEDSEFIAEEEFLPKILLKSEWIGNQPTNYLGLTVGSEQKSDTFFGAYGNFTFNESYSFYIDAKETAVSDRFQPEFNSKYSIMNMTLHDYEGKPKFLGLFGFRIELENYDIRWEEIFNELGFSADDLENLGSAFSPLNPNVEINKSRFLQNGRELSSKNYSYISLRIPNLLKWLSSSFTLRTLASHRDQTRQTTLLWEGNWRDNWTFFSSAIYTFGKKDGELNLIYKNKFNVGLKYTW